MTELVGLLMLGATFALPALLGPWLLRHLDSPRELAISFFVTGLGVTGLGVVMGGLADALHGGDPRHIAVSLGTVLVGLPALALGNRWLGRRMAKRRSTLSTAVEPMPAV